MTMRRLHSATTEAPEIKRSWCYFPTIEGSPWWPQVSVPGGDTFVRTMPDLQCTKSILGKSEHMAVIFFILLSQLCVWNRALRTVLYSKGNKTISSICLTYVKRTAAESLAWLDLNMQLVPCILPPGIAGPRPVGYPALPLGEWRLGPSLEPCPLMPMQFE